MSDEKAVGKQLISERKAGKGKGWQSVLPPQPLQPDPLLSSRSLLCPTLLTA